MMTSARLAAPGRRSGAGRRLGSQVSVERFHALACAHPDRTNRGCARGWDRLIVHSVIAGSNRHPVALRHAACFNPDGRTGSHPLVPWLGAVIPAEQLRRAALPFASRSRPIICMNQPRAHHGHNPLARSGPTRCLPGHSVRRAALSAWPGNGTSRPPTGCRHGLRRRFCYGVVQHGRSTAPKPETGRVQLTQRRRAAPSRALKVLFASKANGRARPPSGPTRPRGFAPNEPRRAAVACYDCLISTMPSPAASRIIPRAGRHRGAGGPGAWCRT
jgi:hypothetical protein